MIGHAPTCRTGTGFWLQPKCLSASYFGKAVPDAFPFDRFENVFKRAMPSTFYANGITVHTSLWHVQSVPRKKTVEVVSLTPTICCTSSCRDKFSQTSWLCNVIWWCSLADITRFLPSTCTLKSRRSLPEFVKINCSHLVLIPDSTLEWPNVLYIFWKARVATFIHRTNIKSSNYAR